MKGITPSEYDYRIEHAPNTVVMCQNVNSAMALGWEVPKGCAPVPDINGLALIMRRKKNHDR